MLDDFKKIQRDYVDLVLGHFASERKELELTAVIKKQKLIGKLGIVDASETKLRNFIGAVSLFWQKRSGKLHEVLKQRDNFSMVVWNDMGISELLPKYTMCFDSIGIPDPSTYIDINSLKSEEVCHSYLTQMVGWTQLIETAAPAILTDTDRPIAFVFPQPLSIRSNKDNNSVQEYLASSSALTAKFFSEIFSVKPLSPFTDIMAEEIFSVGLKQINTSFDMEKLLYATSSFLIDIDLPGQGRQE